METPLEYGRYYHIYNRGNNYENVFIHEPDYRHFLNIYNAFISPVADTYSWCLMRNHFHLFIRIKEEPEIGYLNSENLKSKDPYIKWKTYQGKNLGEKFTRKPNPTQQFKHFFNAYSRWFNVRHGRRGSLFEKNFERKVINSQKQYVNLIIYIHNNPIKHGFVEKITEYPWTSYYSIISDKPTRLKRNEVIRYFDDVENFIYVHKKLLAEDEEEMKDLIIE